MRHCDNTLAASDFRLCVLALLVAGFMAVFMAFFMAVFMGAFMAAMALCHLRDDLEPLCVFVVVTADMREAVIIGENQQHIWARLLSRQ